MTAGSAELAVRAQLAELQRQLDVLRRRIGDARVAEERPRGTLALLVCRVGEDQVGLALDAVETVVPLPLLAPLPETDPSVAGVLDFHGTFVPVLDVLARLERRARPPRVSDLVVICRSAGRPLGLIVQEVIGVQHGDGADLQDPGADVAHADYLLGVVRGGDTAAAVLVLAVARLVTLVPAEQVEGA